MIRVFQTKRGLGGNCLAACLASIFEVSLESMPDLAPPECFKDWTVQSKLRNAWLKEQGFDYVEIDTKKQNFNWTQFAVPASRCLFAVESQSPEVHAKGYGHFVVGQLVENPDSISYIVLHDPLGPIQDIYSITAVGLFVAII